MNNLDKTAWRGEILYIWTVWNAEPSLACSPTHSPDFSTQEWSSGVSLLLQTDWEGRRGYSPPTHQPHPENTDGLEGKGCVMLGCHLWWEESSGIFALEMHEHPVRNKSGGGAIPFSTTFCLPSPSLAIYGLTYTLIVIPKTISKELPMITLLPNPLAPLKFLLSLVSTTLDRLVSNRASLKRKNQDDLTSTICRLKERQGAKTTSVFQDCVSEMRCQNRNWDIGRKTWFGERSRYVQLAPGDSEVQIRVQGHLYKESCSCPKKQRSHVEKKDRPLLDSPFHPAAQSSPPTHFSKTLLIFSRSKLDPCWVNSKAPD